MKTPRLWSAKFAAAALIIAAMLALILPVMAQVGVSVSTNANLRLRSASGTQSEILAVVPAGTALTATAISLDQGWVVVNYNGQDGWLSLSFVTVTAGNLAELPTSSATFGAGASAGGAAASGTTVSGRFNLRLRAGPGTTFRVLTAIPAGTAVPVVGTSDDSQWLQVTYNGQTGWVAASLVQTISTPVPTVATAVPAATTVPAAADPTRGLTADFTVENVTLVQSLNQPAWFNFRIRNTTTTPIPWSVIGVTAEQGGVPIPSMFQTSWSGQGNFEPFADMTWRDRIFVGGPGSYVLRLTVRFADTGQTVYLGDAITVTVIP